MRVNKPILNHAEPSFQQFVSRVSRVMRSLRNSLAIAAIAAILAACSGSSTKKTYFETEGLRAPEGSCSVKPSRLGMAERLGRISEGNGCHIPDPWSIRSVGSVTLSQPATLNCGMAEPLNDWIENTVQPAAQRAFGESVIGVEVAASYSCRPRNNKRGAKMSEHGYGNAIDISAFTLESGRKVTVQDGWRGGRDEQKFLSKVHGEACGEFRTVLGPNSDRSHRDHLHLDLQNRRSGGTYCR